MGDFPGREGNRVDLGQFREATAAIRENGALISIFREDELGKKLAREFALDATKEVCLQRQLVLSTRWRREMNCD